MEKTAPSISSSRPKSRHYGVAAYQLEMSTTLQSSYPWQLRPHNKLGRYQQVSCVLRGTELLHACTPALQQVLALTGHNCTAMELQRVLAINATLSCKASEEDEKNY